MKKILVAIAIVVIIIVSIPLLQNYLKNNPLSFETATAKANNQTIKLYIAKSAKEKEVGLSDRKSLPEGWGMLFSFEKPDFYPFWMRNMQFPIDIFFIHNNRIVTLFENVQPPTPQTGDIPLYKPDEPASAVIETSAGLAKKYNLKVGDEIKIDTR